MGGGNEAWMVLLVSIAQETVCQKEISHKGRGPRTRVKKYEGNSGRRLGQAYTLEVAY